MQEAELAIYHVTNHISRDQCTSRDQNGFMPQAIKINNNKSGCFVITVISCLDSHGLHI